MTTQESSLQSYSERIDPRSLAGKVAIVTGAGRGLGRGYALALAAAGAAVVVNDAEENSASTVASEIINGGGSAMAATGRIGPEAAAVKLVEKATKQYGRLDIMVTNAGVLRDRVTWKMTEEDFDTVIETHLKGSWTCGKAAIQQMKAQGEGGRVILIGSPAGQFGSFGQSNYASAKAGIVGLGRTWSMELARDKINVNIVVPTAMTAMTATIPAYHEWAEAFERGMPLPPVARREHALGGPEDVTPLVVWLASDDSAAVTGQAFGLGGDRFVLYSHPAEQVTADHDGGWTVAAIGQSWRDKFADHAQPSGPRPKPDPREHRALSQPNDSGE
ncbi:SDR family NAD(P)-dependent oxidoreductase [Nesterenkonia haasae]|uniref:SDR family NAD(P)-dependent oxidoreductase n=1 Tax=Nesterenkonia haasae TaxID=2587813 RepID=UPI0013911E2D|nr:SDR family NAD(P)-dependent oxidoreductase [Nesterenkonia haasae]NDK32578.1 SDR family NAD(P)-dependent oxidoreductase [Nesterenkonia haasae]